MKWKEDPFLSCIISAKKLRLHFLSKGLYSKLVHTRHLQYLGCSRREKNNITSCSCFPLKLTLEIGGQESVCCFYVFKRIQQLKATRGLMCKVRNKTLKILFPRNDSRFGQRCHYGSAIEPSCLQKEA